MSERWRKPVVPLAINLSDNEGIVALDGRIMRSPVFTLSEEDKERMRLGRVCMKCLRPFEQAWPERCPDCGAPIRREQAAFFAAEFDPTRAHIGPSTTLEHERATLDERRAKEEESNGSSGQRD